MPRKPYKPPVIQEWPVDISGLTPELLADQPKLTEWLLADPRRIKVVIPYPNEWCSQQPTPKQLAALMLNHLEVLYGGAARGGKSSWLLMEALRYVGVKGYSALLLRRTSPQLLAPTGLISRAKQWLAKSINQKRVEWNEGRRVFTWPDTGATLQFGHMEHEDDKHNYDGPEFQFIGFDQLESFTQTQYTYMFSRLTRLTDSPLPVRVRSTCNWIGDGKVWVRQRFLLEKEEGRIFLPAGLHDNPYVDAQSYIAGTAQMNERERRAILHGDPWVDEDGGMFLREWFNIIDRAPETIIARVRYWDVAGTAKTSKKADPDYTVGALCGMDANGEFYILDLVRMRGTPGEVRQTILNTAIADGAAIPIGMEQQPGAAGVSDIDHYTKMLAGFNFVPDTIRGDKVTAAGPFSSYAQAGHVFVMRRHWLNELFQELDSFPNGSKDDQIDACSHAFRMLTQQKRVQITTHSFEPDDEISIGMQWGVFG